MAIPQLTTISKAYYEEIALTGENQLYNLLFPNTDGSEVASFQLDRYILEPTAIRYRSQDTQSKVRAYKPGTVTEITVPVASEKTPVSEELRDAVIAGGDEYNFSDNAMRLTGQIVSDHIAGHNMTKNKQAIDLFVSGTFEARNGGTDIGLDIDFSRDAGLSLTYDFTAGGASFLAAIKEAQSALIAQGMPLTNQFVLVGQNWLTEYGADTKVQELAKNNTLNPLIQSQMMPSNLQNIEGLSVVGQVRDFDMVAPVWVLAYTPEKPYKADADASTEPFIADDVAIFGSFADTRTNVMRGVDVFDANGSVVRSWGDIVLDQYSEKDPITEFLRSSTRHCFVPGNINHTASSTGTFA